MMTKVEKKIATAVDRVRMAWAVGVLIASGATLFFLPWWFAIFLIPFGVVTYFGSITLAILYLTTTLTAEEMMEDKNIHLLKEVHRKLESGELQQGPELMEQLQQAGVLEIAGVMTVSDEVVGTFNNATIYEWVEILNPYTKHVERFFYYGTASLNEKTPTLPEEPGKVFANVEGIIYAHST